MAITHNRYTGDKLTDEARTWVTKNYAMDRYRDGWRNGFLIGAISTAIFIMAVVVGIIAS